jgi:hypothetical protein
MRPVILTALLSLAWLALIPGHASAQSGGVEVIVDPAIPMIAEKYVQVNQAREGIPGYRVQIFFDSGNNSKTRGQAVYETFSARFPDVAAYLTFKAPNYKVRVGDFRTRLDAVRFLQQILPDYPGAYVITDQIHLPKVN